MLALRLDSNDLRSFMNKLFAEDFFDVFSFREAEITGFIRFELNGELRPNQGGGRFRAWSEIRPYVFNMIKGSERPESIKLVLSLDDERAEELDKNAKAFFVNIIFERGELLLTTGCALKGFSMDKSAERRWDEHVLLLMKNTGLNFEE